MQSYNETIWMLVVKLFELHLQISDEVMVVVIKAMSERHVVTVAVVPLLTIRWACSALF